jgi:HEAT repeat protein
MQEPIKALEELRDPRPEVRIKAARWLAREALGESLVVRQKWMGNRGTTGPLIEALDDPEPEVAYNAVVAIAEISRRYFRDGRAYPRVIPLLRSKRRQTRFWAVDAARWLRGKRCLDEILPLVRDRSALVRAESCGCLSTWRPCPAHTGLVRWQRRSRPSTIPNGSSGTGRQLFSRRSALAPSSNL